MHTYPGSVLGDALFEAQRVITGAAGLGDCGEGGGTKGGVGGVGGGPFGGGLGGGGEGGDGGNGGSEGGAGGIAGGGAQTAASPAKSMLRPCGHTPALQVTLKLRAGEEAAVMSTRVHGM